MASQDIWGYRDDTWSDTDLVGYKVEALDGSIGKVDDATNDAGSGHIVVDTGPWIFGKKVLLPAGVVDSVDHDETCIYVQRTKDEIKNAPEFNEDMLTDSSYRDTYGTYYGPGGAGYSEGTRDYGRPVGTRSDDIL